MIYQTIEFETDCKRVSTFLKRLSKKYPKFAYLWSEHIESGLLPYMKEMGLQYYTDVVEDAYVIGLDCDIENHFYVWFQARSKENIVVGEGTIYNVNENIETNKQETAQETHNRYRNAQKKIVLVDLIYLALYELETITIASEWVGTNEFDLMPDDLEKRDYTVVWFNFWLRCFIKDFLNVCKIQIGLLNRKLNKEIEQNECVTSYAEYLFYLKNKVKQDYYRLKEG